MQRLRVLLWPARRGSGSPPNGYPSGSRTRVGDPRPRHGLGRDRVRAGSLAPPAGSRRGPLLAATGTTWFAGNFVAAGLYLHRGPLVHLLLADPDGRAPRASTGSRSPADTPSRWWRRMGERADHAGVHVGAGPRRGPRPRHVGRRRAPRACRVARDDRDGGGGGRRGTARVPGRRRGRCRPARAPDGAVRGRSRARGRRRVTGAPGGDRPGRRAGGDAVGNDARRARTRARRPDARGGVLGARAGGYVDASGVPCRYPRRAPGGR